MGGGLWESQFPSVGCVWTSGGLNYLGSISSVAPESLSTLESLAASSDLYRLGPAEFDPTTLKLSEQGFDGAYDIVSYFILDYDGDDILTIIPCRKPVAATGVDVGPPMLECEGAKITPALLAALATRADRTAIGFVTWFGLSDAPLSSGSLLELGGMFHLSTCVG